MSTQTPVGIRLTFIALILLVTPAMGAPAVEFTLDGNVKGRVVEHMESAILGPGAKFIPSVEGEGVEPAPGQPAVTLPVPDGSWTPAGTLAFRVRTSRALRFSEEKPLSVTLAKCPLFTLTLQEHPRHLVWRAAMAHDGTSSTHATNGNLFWSHLKAGKWYHVAFTWDAAKGRMDTYLNGCLQQEMRLRKRWATWVPPANPSGKLDLGGVLGRGDTEARIAVDSVELHTEFMDEAAVASLLKGKANFPLTGEGRWELKGGLDLTPYRLTPVHAADFTKPLNWIHEEALFDGKRRARQPEGKDWVLEGNGTARIEDGACVIEAKEESIRNHLVLWNTRPFPENFLLEFEMSPLDSRKGLTIVFFATRNREGGSLFDPGVPRRAGNFKTYHTGALTGYHVSYWACNPFDGGILRRSANLRKNYGFFMVASGIDRIAGLGAGPHRVRILKVGAMVRVEANGKLSLAFDDDGKTYGPIHKDGWIGLRQMGSAHRVKYTKFAVWRVDRK